MIASLFPFVDNCACTRGQEKKLKKLTVCKRIVLGAFEKKKTKKKFKYFGGKIFLSCVKELRF